MAPHDPSSGEMRLFLEEICCELCRYRHVTDDSLNPEQILTTREFRLPTPEAFADIRVQPGEMAPYYVEIKWGYDEEESIERLAQKYADGPENTSVKLIIVTDLASVERWSTTVNRLKERISPKYLIEAWTEAEVIRQIDHFFNAQVS